MLLHFCSLIIIFFTAFSNISYLEIGTLETASVSKILFLVYAVLNK